MKTTKINATSTPMKRHPMSAIALALATVIATGCSDRDGQDAARFSGNDFNRNAPAAGSFNPVANRDAATYERQPQMQLQLQAQRQPQMQTQPQWQPQMSQPQMEPQMQPQQQLQSPDQTTQKLSSLAQWERRDMGIPATRELHEGQMHGPTPNQIPGGQVITTLGLKSLVEQRVGAQMIDVLGADVALPDAVAAVFAAAAGSFDDRTQQQLAQMLSGVTRNDPSVPLVFYCGGPECWMSYNAALRAIALGYRNVLWYRGGLQAWNQAGLPFARGNSGSNGGNGSNGRYAITQNRG